METSQSTTPNTNKTLEKSANLCTPKNQVQTDLLKIRSTFEKLRKEYSEKFPEETTPLGTMSKAMPLDLSSTSEIPLDLTNFSIHNSPPPPSQLVNNAVQCNSPSTYKNPIKTQ